MAPERGEGGRRWGFEGHSRTGREAVGGKSQRGTERSRRNQFGAGLQFPKGSLKVQILLSPILPTRSKWPEPAAWAWWCAALPGSLQKPSRRGELGGDNRVPMRLCEEGAARTPGTVSTKSDLGAIGRRKGGAGWGLNCAPPALPASPVDTVTFSTGAPLPTGHAAEPQGTPGRGWSWRAAVLRFSLYVRPMGKSDLRAGAQRG